jgi:hypothetical protein
MVRVGSKIPKPWTLKAAFLIIDGACLLFAFHWLRALVLDFSWARIPGVFLICMLVGIDLGLRRGQSVLRIIFIPVGLMCIVPWAVDFSPAYLLALPFVVLPILLYLPPSGKWFASVNDEERPCTEGKATCRRQAPKSLESAKGCSGCLAIFVFAVMSLALLTIMVEVPYIRKSHRYSRMQKDEFLAAASNDVNRVSNFTLYGTNFTAVVLGGMRFLPSGPAVFIFDEEGIGVDRTIDYGDDLGFRERWGFAWVDLRPTNSVSEKVSCEGKDGQHE